MPKNVANDITTEINNILCYEDSNVGNVGDIGTMSEQSRSEGLR